MSTDLEIRSFSPEHLAQVAELLRHLWSDDAATNERVFRWKYDDNPQRAAVPGVVALRQGRVIGFRGYFASAWTARARGPVRILCPGDTCVDPAARQRGLSLAMAEAASQVFTGEFPLFLNTTATWASLPGYRKLGFWPLANKAYASAYRLVDLVRYVAAYGDRPAHVALAASRAGDDSVVAATEARAGEMAELAACPRPPCAGLEPLRSADFFRWRFRRPGGAYIFYYAYAAHRLRAYVILGLSPNRRRGYVLDVLDDDGTSAAILLDKVLARRDVSIVSVAMASMSSSTIDWRGLGFRASGLLRRIERRRTGELPLLIRPVPARFSEQDWRVNGVDARDLGNWCFREMVSDAF